MLDRVTALVVNPVDGEASDAQRRAGGLGWLKGDVS